MTTDIEKLKKKICDKGKTQEAIADAIGVDRSTFYRKLKKGGIGFTVGEIHKIVDAVPLTREEAVNIFFIPEVA